MGYDLKRSHFSIVLEKEVSPGQVITEEGVLLISVLDQATGTEKVQPSAGAASELVAGFAIRDNADHATTSEVETGTVPSAAPYEVQLRNNNLVGTSPATQIQVEASTSGILTVVAGTPGSGDVQVDDVTGLLTFHVDEQGQDVTSTYRYNLTVAESRLKFYQRNINNEASTLFGQVGVGHGHGEVFTDQFDATVDWSTQGIVVYAGGSTQSLPNGTLTGGSGNVALDARVISVPNVNNPLLGIAFNIGGNAS